MELADIVDVNELFSDFYPYVARQVCASFGSGHGNALELGPFAGGLSIELARLCPGMHFTMGDDFPGLLPYFEKKVKDASLADKIKVLPLNKADLAFPDHTFDLVVFRGGLFFWDETRRIMKEAYRVLKPGGLAMIGGGFGADAPNDLIDAKAGSSRDLNRKLGKRVMSEDELRGLLRDLDVEQQATIDRRHGLWAEIRKK